MSVVILAIENKLYDFKVYTAGSKSYRKQFAVSKPSGQLQIIRKVDQTFNHRGQYKTVMLLEGLSSHPFGIQNGSIGT